jgi:hypothetical protein
MSTRMSLASAFGIVLAVAVVGVGAAVAGAFLDFGGKRLPLAVAWASGIAAVGTWIAFALERSAGLAIAATGLVGCTAGALGAIALRGSLERARRMDERTAEAEARLDALVEREASARAAELERTLARARADSVSLLADEERRIAEERRRLVVERERVATDELGAALAATQQRVEQRLSEFAGDLDTAQQGLQSQLERISERQGEVFKQAEARLAADAEGLDAAADEARRQLAEVRADVETRVAETIAAASAELELHGVERRKALHELGERLRRRERELLQLIEREEAEAAVRIRDTFASAERRQLEQLKRVVEREIVRHVEAAGQQFADVVKAARESAAQRLSRELERAVESFGHDADATLAARLAEVVGEGTHRIERRLGEIDESLDRAAEEFAEAFGQRLNETEDEVRRRLDGLVADGESERAVLEARLYELSRRVEQLATRAEERLAAIEALERR